MGAFLEQLPRLVCEKPIENFHALLAIREQKKSKQEVAQVEDEYHHGVSVRSAL